MASKWIYVNFFNNCDSNQIPNRIWIIERDEAVFSGVRSFC